LLIGNLHGDLPGAAGCGLGSYFFAIESKLLHRPNLLSPDVTLISAALMAACLWLLLEPGHRLGVRPTWTLEIVVMFVSVFLQPPPHMSIGLVAPKRFASHVDHP
jgi:hypothetical protein